MRRSFLAALLAAICISGHTQTAEVSEMMQGINFIGSTWYTEAEDLELLDLYKGLRVADVFHLYYDMAIGGHQTRRGGATISKAAIRASGPVHPR